MHYRLNSRSVLSWITAVCLVLPFAADAQKCDLSGKVTDSATHAVPSAAVHDKRLTDGKTYSAKTNTDGVYTIPDLTSGDYMVSAVAGDLKAKPVKVTLAPGASTDLVVVPVPSRKAIQRR